MKVYITLKEDHGYLGYFAGVSSNVEIESVYESYDEALSHLFKTYEHVRKIRLEEAVAGDLKAVFRYFDERDEHEYDFVIYEKELA